MFAARAVLSVLIIACLALTGCSPSVTVSPEAESGGLPQTAVLLPAEIGDGINRERAEGIRELVRRELANRNYALLADELLVQHCPGTPCRAAPEFFEKYGAGGSFKLNIDSIRRINFLAGYYNSISGSLQLDNSNGKELVKVKDRVSQRGGLLFNTGQVLEGVKSSFRNAREGDAPLSEKFARRITSRVPAPPSAAEDNPRPLESAPKVRVKKVRSDIFEICTVAPRGLVAEVLFNSLRSNLRRSGQGSYCGRFLLPAALLRETKLLLQLRSPFGAAVQQPFEIAADE